MSRYHPNWNIEPIFDAANHWKEDALLRGKSVFSEDPIWSDENLNGLNKFFVENLGYGEGNFMGKLEAQLHDASAGVKN